MKVTSGVRILPRVGWGGKRNLCVKGRKLGTSQASLEESGPLDRKVLRVLGKEIGACACAIRVAKFTRALSCHHTGVEGITSTVTIRPKG